MFSTIEHKTAQQNPVPGKQSRSESSNRHSNVNLSSFHFNWSAFPIQPKLQINQPGDRYEQEADRIAEQVVSIPEADTVQERGFKSVQRKPLADEISVLSISNLQRKCSKCEEEEEEKMVQRKENSPGNSQVYQSLQSQLQATQGGGQAMDRQTKGKMNSRFGMDFSKVRIHNDAKAAGLSQNINAKAFTLGNDIYFNRGEYRPDTKLGQRLLAHELVHTVQQTDKSSISSQQIVQRYPDGVFDEVRQQEEAENRIVISCQDMRLKIFTLDRIYSYRLQECQIPLGSYEAQVTVTDNNFHLDFGNQIAVSEEFYFAYRVESNQENPATLLSDIEQINVDVVERLPPPQPTPRQREPTPTCIIELDDRVLVPTESTTFPLFETKEFDQDIWSQEIPLGQFGWVDVVANANGRLEGNLNGRYGPGILSNICLYYLIDRQSSTSSIDHPLLGENSNTEVTTFRIGGRARFRLPANAAIEILASGTLRIGGDYLSVIEVAAAEATLSAKAAATLAGNIDGTVNIVATATRARAFLENDIPAIPGLPITYIIPDTISIENITIDDVDLAAEIGLHGRAGVSIQMDLDAGFDVAGINLWSQSWNLVDFDAGVSWSGGLIYNPDSGINWNFGTVNVAEEDSNSNEEDEQGNSDNNARINVEDIINAILDESDAEVSSPDGLTENTSLPFDWYKPIELYIPELNLPNADEPNTVNRDDGPTYVRYTERRGQRERTRYEMFGVADWPAVNRKFQYIPYDERRTPEQARFNRLIDNLGHDRSGTDAEHVWDVKLRGLDYDRFDNLWPASNQDQQLAGTRHRIQIRNYMDTIGNVNGRWFKIIRVLHPA